MPEDIKTAELPISAEPTKSFFVDMLTRDIALEQAVLDLVDNSVDGAKTLRVAGKFPYEGREVKIEFARDRFKIIDNCGGFGVAAARDYAFRFGRAAGNSRAPHSIGQFGVGMKRALFKFGHHFKVRSATSEEGWSVDVEVPEWEKQPGWTFPWAEFVPNAEISKEHPGVEIVVTQLRPEVANRFATKTFENQIIGLIKSKHRQFIAEGLSISINGQHLDTTSLYLLISDDAKFRPGTDLLRFTEDGQADVTAKIVTGIGPSSPREAGWYVVCNGRVVLEADRRNVTGWGIVEEQSESIAIPNFHNQFARFRGMVFMDSDDSARVPWTTTKTDIDQDSPIWQATFARMVEMMRPVISFLNELDQDIDEHTRDHSPLLEYVVKAGVTRIESLPEKSAFAAPARNSLKKSVKTIKVQYSRPVEQVSFLMKELGVSSAKSVGEETFDLIYTKMGGE